MTLTKAQSLVTAARNCLEIEAPLLIDGDGDDLGARLQRAAVRFPDRGMFGGAEHEARRR